MVYPQRIFGKLESEFLEALRACRARPAAEAVHRVRTSARRLEALLRVVKLRQAEDVALILKIDRALDALKIVRKAAGPVRDLDVQPKLLGELVAELQVQHPGDKGVGFGREGKRVEASLRKTRRERAAELVSVVRATETDLRAALTALPAELARIKWRSLLRDARAQMEISRERLRLKDKRSLHAYRKEIKFARYLADMEEASVTARRLAKQLKTLLDSIGEWHDWMTLTQEAKGVLGKASPLVDALKARREDARGRAVHSVGRFVKRS
ncbi:MAG: CHAD domain-containing protein [Acidobacteriaceae bacterium]